MIFSTLPARAVGVALFAFSVGCASTEPSEPQVATLSGTESFEISYVVNGEPTSETVTTPWSFVIDLDGEFDISVSSIQTIRRPDIAREIAGRGICSVGRGCRGSPSPVR